MPMRRSTRIAWLLLGVCVLVSVAISAVLLLVPAPDKPWTKVLLELGVLIDVAALLLWLLVLARVARRRQAKLDQAHDKQG